MTYFRTLLAINGDLSVLEHFLSISYEIGPITKVIVHTLITDDYIIDILLFVIFITYRIDFLLGFYLRNSLKFCPICVLPIRTELQMIIRNRWCWNRWQNCVIFMAMCSLGWIPYRLFVLSKSENRILIEFIWFFHNHIRWFEFFRLR